VRQQVSKLAGETDNVLSATKHAFFLPLARISGYAQFVDSRPDLDRFPTFFQGYHMHSFTRATVVVSTLAVLWIAVDRVTPQQPGQGVVAVPRLFHLLPTGGRQGTTLELTVSGQDLDQAKALLFSEPGITAELIGPTTVPLTDPKQKQPKNAPKSYKFRVTVPANARLGMHDVRVVTPLGVSNPRAFVVSDVEEVVEQEPNNNVDQMQRVPLNCAVSGTIATPTDVDYFVFAGKKGQRVVVSCLTTSIDSKLPADIELHSSSGAFLGSNHSYQSNDALLDAELPADGDYYVRVSNFSYTLGGPDYFYRLLISTAPWIDAVYPAIVEPGTKATLTVYGRNLPGGKADAAASVEGRTVEKLTTTVQVPADARAQQRLDFAGFVPPLGSGLDGFEFRLRNDSGASNGVLLAYAQAPVVLAAAARDQGGKARPLTLPCEVAGLIAAKGERDQFSFTAKKGQVCSIEIYGDRLGSPVDMLFQLRGPDGKLLKEDDDNPEILSPQFYTSTADPPRYRFVAPADGTYQLTVASKFAYLQAGPRYQYRLRIMPERPDFRMVVMPLASGLPDAPLLHQGGHQVLSVYLWRQDGFSAPITLTGEDLPPGIIVRPQTISSTQKQAMVVVSAAPDAAPWEGAIRLVATATVDGRQIVREVRSASVTWPVPQANVPAVSRLDRNLVVAVRERGPFSLEPTAEEVVVPAGVKVDVNLKLTRHAKDFNSPVQVTAFNLPQGVNLQPLTIPQGKDTLQVSFPTQGVPPGRYTLVFRGQANYGMTDPKTPKMAAGALTVPSSPVTVIIVPKAVAQVTLGSAQPSVKVGGKVELSVTVQRQQDYGGEFKVELVLPTEAKGISAEAITIGANQDTGKLVITAAPDAAIGVRNNLTVRAVALYDGTIPIQHDKKINVSVVK
jgi:hypothetical protein